MTTLDTTYIPTAIPTPQQLAFQDWEFGLFLHFGIRTFYEGHRDWDGKPMSPAAFNPTSLDCDQWARVAQEAGMKYIVFTAKHHDGFANWPSRCTDFSVASTPWQGGHGDVVREFTDACHRHDLKVGLYYSPAEWGSPTYENPKEYDDYFIRQVSELMTGYGEINMLWFDGCGSEGHEYDWPRIIGEIRRMQPNILIFNMGDPDYRWVGNEAGIAPLPCWNTVEAVPVSINTDQLEATADAQPQWLPAECDCRMREVNWFYSDADEHTVKSLDELMGLYYYSIGRGCNLLINIGPDRRGLLPDKDAARLLEFGAEIRRRFGHPLATLSDCRPAEQGWECSLQQPRFIDHAMIQEDLTTGEHVRRFALEVTSAYGGAPIVVYEGRNIGHKAICRFPPIKARNVRLTIREADGLVRIRALELHYARRP
ncbi:MAG: alpha-L-fucosidase [Armatimonadota bacterium]|nr:alpha-L-fucosidase [Armatimonadota bacterium]